MDWHGRRILAGYGFVHIPLTPGQHSLEVKLWRPLGTADQEMSAFLIGDTPALVNHEPLYNTAWRDRCRLVTTSAGTVTANIFTVTRYYENHDIDEY